MNYYEKNLEAIGKINKNFVKTLQENKGYPEIEIINKKNFLVKQGTKDILAYPKGKENEQANITFENVDFYSDECTIIIGIGNGYLLNRLLKKADNKHLFILIEPIFELINNALKYYDFGKHILKGNLMICTSKEELPLILSLIETQRVIQMWHTIIENYTAILSDYYSEVHKLTMGLINQIMCGVGTVMGAGKIIAENDIKNLPYVIKHRGVNEIKGLYKNKPAIVILSAPTVTKLLPQLLNKKVRDKIIIIAIAQMLRPLLAFGIKPDFICSVDYGEVNIEHFDNLWYIKDIPFVALNRTYAPILEKWQGPIFVTAGFNYAPKESIMNMMNEYGQLEQGGSVGHMAIGLGIHLGCDPIIHIGFDCAYDNDEGLSHNKLGDAIGKINFKKDGTLDWEVNDPHSILKEKKHEMGAIIYVPGYFGTPVPTNSGLASFITAMENIFKAHPKIKFINSCEGGGKKKYCEQMSLKLALQKYCKFKINKKKLKKHLTLLPNYENKIEKAKKMLKWEIDLFNEEIKACDKAIEPLEYILNNKPIPEKKWIAYKKISDKFDNDNKQMKKEKKIPLVKDIKNKKDKKILTLFNINEIYSTKAQDLAKQSVLLALHIYKTSREIHKRDLDVIKDTKHLLKNREDLKTRIKRNKMILEAAKESAIKLKKIYEDVLNQLNENPYISEEYKKRLEILKINIKPETWQKLIVNGNWARPLLESEYILSNMFYVPENHKFDRTDIIKINRKCLQMKHETIRNGLNREDLTDKIEFQKYSELSKEIVLKNKDFKQSLKYIKKALKIYPDNTNALWGLATVYNHLGKFDKALNVFNRLIKNNPNNLRFQFEHAQIWLIKDIYKGLNLMKEVMSQTHEWDSFYLRLAELEYGLYNQNQNQFVDFTSTEQINHLQQAKEYIDKYLSIYPHSIDGKELLKEINKLL